MRIASITSGCSLPLAVAVILRLFAWPGAGMAGAEDQEPRTRRTLAQVMGMAVDNNVDVLIVSLQTERSRYQTRQAKGRLLPKVILDASYERIDEDRSATAGQNLPYQKVGIGGSISQQIFDDTLISLFRVAKRDEVRLKLEQEAVELLVIAIAGSQYLDYRESIAREEVETEELERTRRILEFSRTRASAGAGSQADVYRWQAQAANQEGRVQLAESLTLQALSTLNQTLGQDSTASWLPSETEEGMALFDDLGRSIATEIGDRDDPSGLYRAFVEVAVAGSPALQALEQAIAGQRIFMGRAERRIYLPRVEASFEYAYLLDQEFAGTSLEQTFTDLGLPTDGLPTRDDEEWILQAAAVFPFYEGGGKLASIGRERVLTEELLQSLRRTDQIVSRDTVNVVHRIRGSYRRLEFSRQAAGFASQNLEMVDERYRAGAAIMLELIDAQRVVFIADTDAVIARYAYLRDLVDLQRSVSYFEDLHAREETVAWMKAFEAVRASYAPAHSSGQPGPDLRADEAADPPE